MAWSWRNIIETEWLRRAGGAASIMAHVALLALIVFGSGVRLFDTAPPPAIDVELVPAKDAPAETPGRLSLPSLETPKGDDSKPDDSKQDDAKADEPKAEQPDIAKPDDQPATPAPETAAAAAAPEPPALPQAVITGAPVVTPDVMAQYGDPFLSGGFTPDKEAADLKADVVAAFRAHLKSCLKLPEGLSPAGDARLVLRVSLKRDGRLAAPPALMAAKATPQGPLLMKAAIRALEACQPYAMLPAEKYKEWRELDLEFTPAEFQPG